MSDTSKDTKPIVPPSDWRHTHLWHIQPVRDLLALAAVILIVYLGYVLRVVTVPLLLALLLAYLFEPLVRWVTRSRLVSRQGAAVGIIVVAFAVVVVPATLGLVYGTIQGVTYAAATAERAGLLLKAAGSDQAAYESLPPAWKHTAGVLRGLREKSASAPTPEGPDESQALYSALEFVIKGIQANASAIGKQAVGTGVDAIAFVVGAVSSLTMLVFQGFLTAFFFFFACSGYGRLLSFSQRFIPAKGRWKTLDLLAQMDRVIAGFIRGRLTIGACMVVYFTLAYWFAGVPAPLLTGAVVGILSLAPFVAMISIPVAMLLLWLDQSGEGFRATWYWITLAPIIIYVVGQTLDDYVLSPLIQGKSTDMDTPSILFASIAGGTLAGFYGVLVAIPVAACAKILIRELLVPRVRDWVEGRAKDFLPISRGEP